VSILGVIVRAQPAHADAVQCALRDLPGLDIAAADGGRFVVVIEDSADANAGDTLTRITRLERVIATSLVYEYSGPDAPAPDGTAIDFKAWRSHPEVPDRRTA
jgi:nitrate reductase NapAB chaperone NapD